METLTGLQVLSTQSARISTLDRPLTCPILFFHLESRKVEIAGMTPHPTEAWMTQSTRNVTMDEWGFLDNCRYLIDDRGTKCCRSFRKIIKSDQVKPIRLPARGSSLNAFSERWVKSAKNERLSKLMLFDEASLPRALREYLPHYHAERNHQGKDNILLFPTAGKVRNHSSGAIGLNKRLGGLLKY